MSMLHPIDTTNHLRTSYLRYLKTIYPFQDVALRQQFWEALEEPDRLVKGPLLEAAPPFERGRSIQQLVEAGVLHPSFAQLCSDALPWDRPFHLHQDQAITNVVQKQRNLIVATGTGSGKTESFLLPILDHLLREEEAGTLHQPGVRALLLYPMNALANDQLKRLRRLLRHYPQITFGRYTGETEKHDDHAKARFAQQFPGEDLLENELLSRTQLRANPPHILLTNYAMLEYLLVRPEDCSFFDGESAKHWRFIALDEAHIYDGAIGIEIAMLLRRLKDRVAQSQSGRIRCIATSATMGRGRVDFPDTVRFASNLFGEPFMWDERDPDAQDVVEATRVATAALGEVWGQSDPSRYGPILSVCAQADEVPDMGERPTLDTLLARLQPLVASFAPSHVCSDAATQARACWSEQSEDDEAKRLHDALNTYVYAIFCGDQRIHDIHNGLRVRPQLVWEAAAQLFPGVDQGTASEQFVQLIQLAVRARPRPGDRSLLPARYHVFARALEGVFVCLNHQKHADGNPRIFLGRHEKCPECEGGVVELASCTRCGATYVVGELEPKTSNGKPIFTLQQLAGLRDGMGSKAYFLLDAATADLDEDEEVASGEQGDATADQKPYTLCLRCLQIAPEGAFTCACGDAAVRRRLFRLDLKNKPEPHECLKCASRSNGNLIFRFLTGQDAPVSVLATALYQKLPISPHGDEQLLPGEGRKLLIFADSRQDAAFFAPYLERTYNQVLHRRLILKTLLFSSEGRMGELRLQDLAGRLMKEAAQAGLFRQAMSRDKRMQMVNTWLMQEATAMDRRISLEGLGLLAFRLVRPERWQPPAALAGAPWHMSADESWTLIALLLDTLRQQSSMTFPDNVDPASEDFAPRNRIISIREEASDVKSGILSWVPSRGSNRRVDLLMRVLAQQNPALSPEERRTHAIAALRGIWKAMTEPRSVWREHMVSTTLPGHGVVYRLSHEFWELVPSEQGGGYRCNKCRAVTSLNLRGICPTRGCSEGKLELLDSFSEDVQGNHYRVLYQTLAPIPFTAEEHTAQWNSEEAGKIQESFVHGEINALSCSTTFELGVDVGELQAVLMRNVPPTTANYVQRAGRTGRRTDSAAFALTYAQRRSHDLAHYADPARIVAGKISTPRIVLTNEKIIRRHMQAVLIAAFFRAVYDESGQEFSTVGAFFRPEDRGKPGTPQLMDYAECRPAMAQAALRRIVPAELQDQVGVETWAWLRRAESDGMLNLLDMADAEVNSDFDDYEQFQAEAANDKLFRQAEAYQQVLETLRGRALLGFFASRNLLPKYGFPTDIVSLHTEHLSQPEATKLQLERDLRIALSEYAPGSEVVAAKRIWRSSGIYRQPRKEWETRFFAICSSCGRLHQSTQEIGATCPACGGKIDHVPGRSGRYIKPEFGFVVAHSGVRSTSEARPERVYASRVYFSEYAPQGQSALLSEPSFETVSALSSPVLQVAAHYSRFGKLALVNAGHDGRGFRVCQWCGFAEAAPAAPPPGARRGQKEQPHKHPRTGKACKGFMQSFHLGHEFLTDVVELRFSGALANSGSLNLWRSLTYALLEGASEELSIRRDDIDGTLYFYGSTHLPAIVLYDNVPGGAGHVQRIYEQLPMVFRGAYERVRRPCCGPETSCYECLRNYRNQAYHDQLQRGVAAEFLEAALTAAQQLS